MAEVEKKNLKITLEKAYEEFADAIFRYCYFHTSSREKALDITQDTFIKTLEYLSGGKDIDNLRPFLYRVARNLIIDERRKKKAESLDTMRENGFELSSEESEITIREKVFEAKMALETIEELGEKYKEVIILRFVEDMSVKDMAKILGKSENTVSVRIHRAVEKLKNILGQEK